MNLTCLRAMQGFVVVTLKSVIKLLKENEHDNAVSDCSHLKIDFLIKKRLWPHLLHHLLHSCTHTHTRTRTHTHTLLIGSLSTVWKETHVCSIHGMRLIWSLLQDWLNHQITKCSRYTLF